MIDKPRPVFTEVRKCIMPTQYVPLISSGIFFRPSVCVAVCLFVGLSVCPSFLFVGLSVSLYPFDRSSAYLSFCLFDI